MYKRIMVVLFALSLVAMWRVEAEAGCSCIRQLSGGSCLTNCGTIIAQGLLSSLSGIATGAGGGKFIEVGAEGLCPGVSAFPGGACDTTRAPVSGVFSCQNNGGKFAEGQQPEVIAGADLLGQSSLAGQLDKKGKFKNVSVTSLVQNPSALDFLCHDLGGGQTWKVFDVAFCDADPAVSGPPGVFEVFGNVLLQDDTVDGQLRLVCTGSCADVQFVSKTGTFTGNPYTCDVCPMTADQSAWDCKACALAGVGGTVDCQPFVAGP